MKIIFTLLLLLILIYLSTCDALKEKSNPGLPNIIFIISDDQGWTDYGFMNHPAIKTPHIDRLANKGITYTRGYVTAPLCSPSLASMITGIYPHQHGITGNDPEFSTESERYSLEWLVDRKEPMDTLIEQFKENPLLTGILAEHGYLSFQTGKWWLGSYRDGGFDYGMTHGIPEKGGRHGDNGLEIGRQGMDTLYRFVELAIEKKQPFFIWYAPFLPHAPHDPPDSLLNKYLKTTSSESLARYMANCEWFDVTVGQLLNHLEEKNLTDKTMILFVCDNGWAQDPERPNRYLEGSKRAPYDLGIRTPMIISWPGRIESLRDTLTLVSSIDLVPTVLHALEIPQPGSLQGISLLERSRLKERDRIFSEVFYHDIKNIRDPVPGLKYRILIKDSWKLIIPDDRNLPDNKSELYDVLKDPFEDHNLVEELPGLAGELKKEIDDWWKPGFE